jgi:heme oxygenase (biliverdin-producing, ferredoxin)
MPPPEQGNRRISEVETENDESVSNLVRRMRRRTSELHIAAERSGVVAALIRGHVSRSRYALFLRNLLPAYQAMELALLHRRGRPNFDGLAQPSLYRAERIVADLVNLEGSDWAAFLPLLASGEQYAARVEWAGPSDMLIAHCYTRYLGDLYGGRMLTQRIMTRFGPEFRAVAFLTFPDIGDLDVFREAYRRDLDRAGGHLSDIEGVVEEAAVAFELNIRLSLEVGAWPDSG